MLMSLSRDWGEWWEEDGKCTVLQIGGRTAGVQWHSRGEGYS